MLPAGGARVGGVAVLGMEWLWSDVKYAMWRTARGDVAR
jgi:hypothetical protein